jgi:hypothetical protein
MLLLKGSICKSVANTAHKAERRVHIVKIGGKPLRRNLYLAALNTKKTTAPCKVLCKRQVENGTIFTVCNDCSR